MSSPSQTIEDGSLTVEVDEWGGCHIHFDPDELKNDGTISLSPRVMERIDEGRDEVRKNDE